MINGEGDDEDFINDGCRSGTSCGFSASATRDGTSGSSPGTPPADRSRSGKTARRGRQIYFDSVTTNGHAYRPVPHVIHLGSPVGRAGPIDASISGASTRTCWVSAPAASRVPRANKHDIARSGRSANPPERPEVSRLADRNSLTHLPFRFARPGPAGYNGRVTRMATNYLPAALPRQSGRRRPPRPRQHVRQREAARRSGRPCSSTTAPGSATPSCEMCNNWKWGDRKSDMTLAQLEPVMANPFWGAVENLNISGGEPTTRNDLPEMVEMFQRHLPRMRKIGINTTGLTPHRAIPMLTRIVEVLRRARPADQHPRLARRHRRHPRPGART